VTLSATTLWHLRQRTRRAESRVSRAGAAAGPLRGLRGGAAATRGPTGGTLDAPGLECMLQVTLVITTKLLLIQSDLVSLSLTIALPKALGSASARGEFSPS
jgi:hypothetical protein